MDEHGQRLSSLGLAAEDAGQRIKELKEAHGDLREANSKLGVKVIDLEGLSLWKNLQILDLAESTQSGLTFSSLPSVKSLVVTYCHLLQKLTELIVP